MKLKDIIIRAAMIVGLDGVDTEVPSAALTKLTDCANTVYSMLVLEHVPLKNKEIVTFTDGKAFYADFSKPVREVLKVTSGAGKHKFTSYPKFISAPGADGDCEVEYLFHAPMLGLEEELILPPQFTVYVLAIGVASEYFYRIGYLDEAEFYKSRYEVAVFNCTRKSKSITLPARRII